MTTQENGISHQTQAFKLAEMNSVEVIDVDSIEDEEIEDNSPDAEPIDVDNSCVSPNTTIELIDSEIPQEEPQPASTTIPSPVKPGTI